MKNIEEQEKKLHYITIKYSLSFAIAIPTVHTLHNFLTCASLYTSLVSYKISLYDYDLGGELL